MQLLCVYVSEVRARAAKLCTIIQDGNVSEVRATKLCTAIQDVNVSEVRANVNQN